MKAKLAAVSLYVALIIALSGWILRPGPLRRVEKRSRLRHSGGFDCLR